MQLSDIPAWFAKRFGADATGTHIRTVPAASSDPNAASMALGFPPNTFVDIGAGGAPMDGRDLNGILNYLSAWTQWAGVGGPAPWSSAISAAAGGYPAGAIVLSTSTAGRLYQSSVNANVTNPDTGGAGWAILVDKAATLAEMTAGTSDERVVTPSVMLAAGFDRVVAQSLIENGGFRIYASGYKECWGRATAIANGSTTVVYPIPFAAFSNATFSAARQSSSGDQNDPGVYSCGLTSFSVWSASNVALSGYWQAKGR